MTYGTIKVDTVTFTDAGVDKSVTLSGLVQNPTFSGNVTVTGTLSGVTVTGTTANFTSGNFTNISGGTHTITSGVFASGSAASPSITFTGDLNTGIYSPGADQVAISTSGTGRLFIDASGNVGIGVSPAFVFEAYKASAGTVGRFRSNGTDANLSIRNSAREGIFGSDNNQSYLLNTDAYPWTIWTNNTERLRITSTGTVNIVGAGSAGSTQAVSFNGSAPVDSLVLTSGGLVGVGTSSPGTLVEGRITGGGGTPATSGTSQPNAVFRVSGSGTTGVLDIGCNSGAPWIQSTDRTDLSQKYSLLLNPNGGSVGIKTSSPSALLSVASTTTSYTAESFNIGEPSLSTGRQLYMGYNTADGVGFIQPVHWGTEFKPLVLCPNGGRVGIGDTGPDSTLTIKAAASTTPLRVSGPSSEFLRCDSSGRLLVGTSSSRSTAIGDPRFQVEGTTYGESSVQMICNSAADAFTCAHLAFGRSKTTAIGGTGQVVNGDRLGAISWNGAQNSTLSSIAGLIECYVDGEVQTGGDTTDMPGRLVFSTTADGASSPTERMRITSSGAVLANTTSPVSGNSNTFNSADTSINTWALAGRHTAGSGSGRAILALLPNETANTSVFFLGNSNSLDKFIVWSDGNVVNVNNSYGPLASDERLKQDIADASSQWDDIKSIRITNFHYKNDPVGPLQLGPIAQELEKVSPGLITRRPASKDEIADPSNGLVDGDEVLSFKASVLYMKAVKALQEAMERIETLEAKVAALESA